MPNTLPRRNIEEIATLYLLESTLNDFYVEGPFDQSIMCWYFSKRNVTFTEVYKVDDIQIDDSLLGDELEHNNRDRLIYLIKCLNSKNINRNYIGIIDKDILMFTRGLPSIDNLYLTDYSCMEMYAFCESIFDKINRLCFVNRIDNIPEFIESLVASLSYLSALVIYEKRHNMSIEKTDFTKHISVVNEKIKFNYGNYLISIVNKNKLSKQKDDFTKEIEIIRREITSTDPRNYCNGHYMISLVQDVLRKKHIINAQTDETAIRNTIIAALDEQHLSQYPLFTKIEQKSTLNQ